MYALGNATVPRTKVMVIEGEGLSSLIHVNLYFTTRVGKEYDERRNKLTATHSLEHPPNVDLPPRCLAVHDKFQLARHGSKAVAQNNKGVSGTLIHTS